MQTGNRREENLTGITEIGTQRNNDSANSEGSDS